MNTSLNILFPVYNEEQRLESGITRAVDYLSAYLDISFLLTIVDNASTDRTAEIARELCERFPEHVRYLRITQKGVGAAFRAGVADNRCDIVGYTDIDLSTDLQHFPQMVELFRSDAIPDMVNGSRFNKQSDTSGRKWYRNITSHGLVWLLYVVFGMRATDAICGFKFFKKAVAERLIREAGASSDGWFYLIELLLRAERDGLAIYEIPVKWTDDADHSKVQTLKVTAEYLRQIKKLKSRFKTERVPICKHNSEEE